MIFFIYRSLYLDIFFLTIPLPLTEKVIFILKKYLTLLRTFTKGFQIGESFTTIFNEKYFFDDKFGIAFLQSVYVDHAYLKKYISPKSIVIDIGANIGQFNFFCRKFLKAKKVFSFEPVEQSYMVLKKNAGMSLVYNFAISSKKKIKFFIPGTSLMASTYQLNTTDNIEYVKGARLSDFQEIKNVKIIDLFKIDVEGLEYDVLSISKDIVKKSKYLLIEVSITRDTEYKAVDIISLLHSFAPSFQLLEVGRIHRNHGKIFDLDMLFVNTSFI